MQETTIHQRRERLRVIIDGFCLGDAYRTTLDRVKAQGGQRSKLGMTALVWICHSERPLGAEELCQALAVEIGSTDYNTHNSPSIQTVLSCCQGLVVVDKERSIVRLVHYTLQDYLINHRTFFQNPHATIAETCLTYLNLPQVMALSGSRAWSTPHSPFLEYSSLYWGVHMKKEFTKRGKALVLKLFNRYGCHISIRLLLEHTLGRYSLRSVAGFNKFSGIHCASIFGLVEVARALTLMDSVDINGVDETGATPLLWAAKSGNSAMVQFLLGQEGLDPDMPDSNDQAPISCAAENGHDAVVKLLLGRQDVNPNRQDRWERTPISWAAENGHAAVVELLLGQGDVKPDRLDYNCQTPLSCAAENGHEAVVKLLLGRGDVNADTPDEHDRTPISWAAEKGREGVVKLLLGREDVNPDRPDNWDQTPILWAAKNGHVAVVKLLLDRKDVNPDRPDNSGRTPISWAAGNGREAVVELLAWRKDVNLFRPDHSGQTPSSLATKNGHEAVVKLFRRALHDARIRCESEWRMLDGWRSGPDELDLPRSAIKLKGRNNVSQS